MAVIGEPFQRMVDWLLDGLKDFADAYIDYHYKTRSECKILLMPMRPAVNIVCCVHRLFCRKNYYKSVHVTNQFCTE